MSTSRYFVRHINDTPSASTNPAVPAANTIPANNEVRQYFNADNRAVHSVPHANESTNASTSADSKIFTSDGLTFKRIDGGNTVEVVGLAAASSAFAVVIPPTTSFLNLPVVRIANDAFKNASRLRTITIPASVEEIGDRAFAGSTLESITLLPSIKKMGKEAFAGCTNLVSINMGASLVEIEDKTFINCPALKKVIFPETLNTLGNSVFENAFVLESLSLPDRVTSIGDRAFYNCKSLATLETSVNLQAIGEDAFNNCVSLNNITPCEYIQDNVQLLEDTALYKNAAYDSYGVKAVFGTILDVTEPKFKYYQQKLPSDAQVIAPYAFLHCTQTTVELPKTIRLLMPNALVQSEKIKIVDNGVIKNVDGLAVKMHVIYAGSVADWRAVAKLNAEQRYPVCVTCTGNEKDGKTTFIDYI